MSSVAGGLKAGSKAKPQTKPRWKRIVKKTVWWTVFLGSAFLITGAILFFPRLAKAEKMIPNLPGIMEQISSQPTAIVSADDVVLYSMQEQYRKPVGIDEVPQVVIDATLAAEDKRFRRHDGVDFVTMMNIAGQTVLRGGDVPRGGSTLTMQIAKRVYTSPAQTMDRKLDDMALAIQIERVLTKDQILELYLNQVYYGKRAYGIAAAADVYFGKELKDLTVAEAAMLSRLVRRPSDENPFDNLEVAIENRNTVLYLMLEEGYITEKEYYAAKEEEPKLAKERPITVSGKKKAPYFVDAVMREFARDFPGIDLKMGGYRIETTLNWDLQKYAEEVIDDAVKSLSGKKVTTAAMFLTDDDGAVLVHVGGDDYEKNQFDVITQGARQPGSAFKPFVYATAFDRGLLTPYSMVSNDTYYWPSQYGPPKKVHNNDGVYGGSMTVERALLKSYNVPAARVMVMTGPANVVALAKNGFGFESDLAAVPALALGATAVSPLELARAYSVFKNGGDRIEPYFIKRVIGPDGQVVKRYSPSVIKSAVNPYAARTMDTLLYKNARNGTGFPVTRDGVVNGHGKTGTTNDFRDAWFCGYTDRFVGIGWVGSEVRKGNRWVYQEMNRVYGGSSVAPFWAKIVKRAQEKLGESKSEFTGAYPDNDISVSPDENMFEEIPSTPPPDEEEDDESDTSSGRGTRPPIGDPPDPVYERSLDVVYAEVCADTGWLSTPYCPERVSKPYLSGSEPKSRCPEHRPPH